MSVSFIPTLMLKTQVTFDFVVFFVNDVVDEYQIGLMALCHCETVLVSLVCLM